MENKHFTNVDRKKREREMGNNKIARSNTNMTVVRPYLLKTTLNINKLNHLIKRHRVVI